MHGHFVEKSSSEKYEKRKIDNNHIYTKYNTPYI